MPAVIPVIIAGGLGAAGAIISGGSIIAGLILGAGLGLLGILTAPSLDNPERYLRTIRKAITPGRWILGRARTGADMVFFHEDDRNLHMALVLSEGSLETIERIWIGSTEIQFTRRNFVLTPVPDVIVLPSGQTIEPPDNRNYNGKIWFVEHFTADGTRGLDLRNAAPEEWTTDHRLEGKSWVHVQLYQPNYGKRGQRRFWSSIPEITFQVKGLKITWPGQATPTWTENAAALRYWWLRERRGVPAEAIDEASFRAAYALCEEVVRHDMPPEYAGYPSTSRRYAINGVISSDDSPDRVEAEMDFAWQGFVVERDGMHFFRPGADRVVSGTIDPDDIADIVSIQPAAALQDRVNSVSMQLAQSREHDWLQFSLPPIEDAAAQARDGIHLPKDLGTRAFVADPIAAGRLAATALRRARASAVFTYRLKPGAGMQWLSVIPGDWLFINDPEHGLYRFQVMVMVSQLNPDWSVTLTMIEQPDGVYADTLVLPPLLPRPIVRPNTRVVPQVQNLALDYGFRESRDGSVVWYILVAFSDTAWQTRIIVEDISDLDDIQLIADETTSSDQARIVVDTPSTYRVTAMHLSLNGYTSVPVTAEIDFSDAWNQVPVPVPIVIEHEQLGNLLRVVALPVEQRALYDMQINYSSGPYGGSEELDEITADNWDPALTLGKVFAAVTTGNQPIVCNFLLPHPTLLGSRYRLRLFARFHSTVLGAGPVREIGYLQVIFPRFETKSNEYWPLWMGEMQNFYLWPHDNEYRLYADREDRNAIAVSEWDYEPFWPFGYLDNLPAGIRSYFNAQSRWFKGELIDMEVPSTVEISYDIEFFHPEVEAATFGYEVWVVTGNDEITEINFEDVARLVPADTDNPLSSAADNPLSIPNVRYLRAIVLFTDRKTPALHRFAFHVGRTG